MKREYETVNYETQLEFDAGLIQMSSAGWRLHSWQFVEYGKTLYTTKLFFVVYELGA